MPVVFVLMILTEIMELRKHRCHAVIFSYFYFYSVAKFCLAFFFPYKVIPNFEEFSPMHSIQEQPGTETLDSHTISNFFFLFQTSADGVKKQAPVRFNIL